MNSILKLSRRPIHRWLLTITMSLLMGGLVAGCQKPNKGVSEMDNPWHHYAQGMEALENGKTAKAASKFKHVLTLDKEFSAGLSAQAIIKAMQAVEQEDEEHRAVDVGQAMDLLSAARAESDGAAEAFIYNVNAIRVMMLAKPAMWLDQAKQHHRSALAADVKESALPYYQNKDAADYYMAKAWFNQDFRESAKLLEKVMGARASGKWQGPANRFYQRVQKIVRAAAGHTVSGKALQIAVKESVTRGDTAALLVDELKLDRLLAGRIPVKSIEAKRKADFTPADVMNHPFKDEILTMMKWKVRGLEPSYDSGTRAWLFVPEGTMPRKDLALALEDVLVALTHNEALATANIGAEHSPYPDVPPNVPWFNACMTAVTRGLMELGLSGEFRPNEPVTGADLLLAVFKLRNVMNIH